MRTVLIWTNLAAMAVATTAQCQITGAVFDSLLRRPVPGAVITALDANRAVVMRALADDSGRFRIEDSTRARRLRVVKIGFRPTEVRVTAQPGAMRIAMQRLPSLLEPVRTSDQPRCARNPTRPAAFGLWEQARAALLGTVVARQTNVALVQRLNFRRSMGGPRGDVILRQSVRRDSGLALRSFDASYPASEFGRRGFAETDSQYLRFFGPDAEVLLDDAFIDRYCLELAPTQTGRTTQVGLRFRPMARKVGRVDIDGTLWIDTLARSLSDIEYGYVGLQRWANELNPGGRIAFRETSPSTVWIDQWWIRLTGAGIDTGGPRLAPSRDHRASVTVAGGELASARWPSGEQWTASLGGAELRLVDRRGAPLANARAQLDSTDYRGVTDAAGSISLSELLPGPYAVSIFDSTLAVVDLALPGDTTFQAARDSISRATISVPSTVEFAGQGRACKAQGVEDTTAYVFIGRIVGPEGKPAERASWSLEPPLNESGGSGTAYGRGKTGSDGLVYVCHGPSLNAPMMFRAWKPGESTDQPAAVERYMLVANKVTTVRLQLPP